ncbi:MAG: hypothetical protein COA33_010850 [Fluviicola sp.]|nr:hypothetical protein [Fluviicola sp.]
MSRNTILREILSDKELMEKYGIKEKDLDKISTSPPFYKDVVETMATIINEKDNHLSDSQIYTRIKNIYKL